MPLMSVISLSLKTSDSIVSSSLPKISPLGFVDFPSHGDLQVFVSECHRHRAGIRRIFHNV